ncbi:heparinase II/III family protein [Niveispirillum fermenti]|uniref:heparinase II/III family protein n=1 Tax=Niveispirillum fermenti TaxID=1233113 RepID=UPI003A836C72
MTAGVAHKRFKPGSGAWYRGTALYQMTALSGPVPAGLSFVPPDPWPGDAQHGQELLNNRFRFTGQSFSGELPPWLEPGASAPWLAEMHGFDWLRHLRATGGDAARRQARVLVSHWLDLFGRKWDPVAWAPDVLATRVTAWIGQHDFFLASADDQLRARVFDSLARQVRFLDHAVPGRLKGGPLLTAVKGMVYGGLCLSGLSRVAERAGSLLARELPRQVLPDGGHVEHSPASQLLALRHLIDMRGCYRAGRADVPEALQHAIDRMTPTLRFFRHGDGGLALFNGAQEGEAVLIDTVLGQADARGRPLKSTPHIGFERITAGRTCILMDTGVPPAPGLDEHAHAGTLSFEMSIGRERLIVNCGAHPGDQGPWRAALAATAAHSTVTIDDTNSSAVNDEGGLTRRPSRVRSLRQDAEEGTLVEAHHDGYQIRGGFTHHRRLFLAESGEDLRGQDTLTGAAGHKFAVRFHLHPGVRVATLEDEAALLLRLPSGALWKFRAGGAGIETADSIYLGQGAEPRPTVQIVLRGITQLGETPVKWGFRREGSDIDS